MTSTAPSESAPQEEVIFFRHSKKTEWGLALIAWENDGKRGYKFEDGQLRVIAEPYYKLLEPAEEPPADSPLMAELARMRRGAAGGDADQMSAEEQMGVFHLQFPGGFGSDEWRKAYRGRKDARRLKRHREPAIAEAQELLSAAELDKMIEAGQHTELQTRLVEVLQNTDLVSKAHLEPLRRGVGTDAFSIALRAALYGDEDHDTKITELFRQMSMMWSRVPWTIPTALLALVHPKDYVCVKPSVFTRQAVLSPLPIRPSATPTARAYRGYLEMARQLRSALSDGGAPPNDLWDIHDFVWITQRPAAVEFLGRYRADPKAAKAAKAAKAEEVAAKAEEAAKAAAPADADADANEAEADAGEANADAGEANADAGEANADADEANADAGEANADAGEADAETSE